MRKLAFAALAAASVAACSAFAAYPDRPVRFIVSSGAGGAPDFTARILAAELTKQMGSNSSWTTGPARAPCSGRR